MPLAYALNSFRRFASAYLWVVRQQLRTAGGRIGAVVALGAVGAVAQGLAIAFVAFAVDSLQKARPIGISSLEAPLREGATALGPGAIRLLDARIEDGSLALALYSLLLLAVVLIGSWATYAAALRTRALARGFHKACALSSLGTFSRGIAADEFSRPRSESEISRLVIRDAAHLGRGLQTIVRMIEPIFRLVVVAGLLLWLDLRLSAMLAPLILVLLPVVYRLNARAQRDSQQFFEEAAVGMTRRVGGLVRWMNRNDVKIPSSGETWAEELYSESPAVVEYFRAYDRLQLAQERAQFQMSVIGSVFLALGLLGGGYLSTVGRLSWGMALGYLMALWRALGAAQTVQAHAISLSLYYPAIIRFKRFREGLGADEGEVSETSEPRTRIVLSADRPLPESRSSLELEPGQPVFYVTDQPLDRITLAEALQPLWSHGTAPRDFWTSQTCFFGTNFGAEYASVLGKLSLASESDEVDAGAWERLDDSDRLAFLATLLRGDPRLVVFIGVPLLARADPTAVAGLFEALRDRFVLLVAQGPPVTDALASQVVVAEKGRIAGLGDLAWFQQARDRLPWFGRPADAAADLDEDPTL